jgi:RNA polymerase sigma-70 factor (ECF subfamily)
MELTELSDKELVERIKEGSEQHFNILYNRYFKRVYNFTYQKVRDHGEAEELVQEIFYCVFTSLKNPRRKVDAVILDLRIMKNNINNFFRGRGLPRSCSRRWRRGLRTVRAPLN